MLRSFFLFKLSENFGQCWRDRDCKITQNRELNTWHFICKYGVLKGLHFSISSMRFSLLTDDKMPAVCSSAFYIFSVTISELEDRGQMVKILAFEAKSGLMQIGLLVASEKKSNCNMIFEWEITKVRLLRPKLQV